MPAVKQGALTREELRQIWEGSVDEGYRDPLEAAGEGEGFEVWTQMFEQFARVSKAIDVTTQAMFIAPWSGQTNPPAASEAKATVTLTIARSGLLTTPLLLGAGTTVVVEETTEPGEVGGVLVRTGRRYVLATDLFFPPGLGGAAAVQAYAEFPGYGYNNPRPGTLSALDQRASDFENDLATTVVDMEPLVIDSQPVGGGGGQRSSTTLVAAPQPDMFVPEHLGQYVVFTAGANAGKIGRLVSFGAPVPPTAGSSMKLEMLYSLALSSVVGTFAPGDLIFVDDNLYLRAVDYRVVGGIARLSGVLVNGQIGVLVAGAPLVVQSTSAAANIDSVDFDSTFVAETEASAWRILDWVTDWKITVTNVLSPENGRSGFLDEIGRSRNIGRSPGETDDTYRPRVQQIADVVAPNAVRRALNRAIPDVAWCFREAGTTWPGFFYDGDGSPASGTPHGQQNDPYDTDVILIDGASLVGSFEDDERVVLEDQTDFSTYVLGFFGSISGSVATVIRKSGAAPIDLSNARLRGLTSGAALTSISTATVPPTVATRRTRTYLDYEQFRGFFFVSVPPQAFGEFGFAYDQGPLDAYDLPPLGPLVGYDGFPVATANFYRLVFDSVDRIKAGGVGWQLLLDSGSCP